MCIGSCPSSDPLSLVLERFLTFSGIWTFLVDAYPSYAASALAANSFLRSAFAVGFPLFADQSLCPFSIFCLNITTGEEFNGVSQTWLPVGNFTSVIHGVGLNSISVRESP
jgi:hypothetical protein